MKNLVTFFGLIILIALQNTAYSSPRDSTFTIKSIEDSKIVAVAKYNFSDVFIEENFPFSAGPIGEEIILAGGAFSFSIAVNNLFTGTQLYNQTQRVSFQNGATELVLGNNSTGRLKVSYDTDNGILTARFSLKVDDEFIGIDSEQFRLSILADFSEDVLASSQACPCQILGQGNIGTSHFINNSSPDTDQTPNNQ